MGATPRSVTTIVIAFHGLQHSVPGIGTSVLFLFPIVGRATVGHLLATIVPDEGESTPR